jgi:hypothetical protein
MIQIGSIKWLSKNTLTPGVIRLKYVIKFYDEAHYEHSTFFIISVHHNIEDNTLEYNHDIHVTRLYNGSDIAYISPTEIIDLNNVETDKDLLVKLMYSNDEYLEYLVNNKINIDEQVQTVANLVLDMMNQSQNNEKFNCKEYLGINPLKIKLNDELGIRVHSNMYSVPLYINNIRMNLNIIFPEKSIDRTIKYTYKICNIQTNEKVDYCKCKEIKLSELELMYTRKSICMRLVNIYHIVDNIFETELEKEEKWNTENLSN